MARRGIKQFPCGQGKVHTTQIGPHQALGSCGTSGRSSVPAAVWGGSDFPFAPSLSIPQGLKLSLQDPTCRIAYSLLYWRVRGVSRENLILREST